MSLLGTTISLTVILLITGLIFLFFLLFSFATNIITLVPWVKTPEENIKKILDELRLPPGALIYDLGCGDGRFLFAAEQRGYRGIGYELSLHPYLIARLVKNRTGSAVRLFRKNFFSVPVAEADAVFVFLARTPMPRLSEKLVRELRPGTPVVSYGFKLTGLDLERTLNTKPSLTYFYKT